MRTLKLITLFGISLKRKPLIYVAYKHNNHRIKDRIKNSQKLDRRNTSVAETLSVGYQAEQSGSVSLVESKLQGLSTDFL